MIEPTGNFPRRGATKSRDMTRIERAVWTMIASPEERAANQRNPRLFVLCKLAVLGAVAEEHLRQLREPGLQRKPIG